MKKLLMILAIIPPAHKLCAGLGGFILLAYWQISTLTFAQSNQWVWMKGDTIVNPSVYGTKGVPNAANRPGGSRYEAAEWTDFQGNFWLFGGGNLLINDLWKYDPLTNMWTWIHGDTLPLQPAVYGTQGVPAPTNKPGPKGFGASSWIDNNGDLWLFGGLQAGVSYTNDLWKYNIATDQWTWMKGDTIINQPGIYGTQGIPNAANTPGARNETSCSWTDNNGNLWLFGGTGYASDPIFKTTLNDLWKYEPTTNMWTWMKGSNINVPPPPSVYGIKGIPNAANTPGAEFYCYTSWKDTNDDLWFFAGGELWKYHILLDQWAWIDSGPSPIYGTKYAASPSNTPGARLETRARWIDDCGNLWFFGGDVSFPLEVRNDLWRYNLVTDQWTWISGDNVSNQPSIYGTMGVPAPGNKPSARMGSVGWRNKDGLWLLGGWINSAAELWKYIPDKSLAGFFPDTTSGCPPLTVNFINSSDPKCNEIKSYLWNFDDPASGSNNTSTLANPSHQFNSDGIYNVKLVITDCTGGKDSVVQTIIVGLSVFLGNGNDTTLCGIDSIILDAGNPGSIYQWSTGANTQTITVNTVGTYWVEVDNGSCIGNDTIIVDDCDTTEPPIFFIPNSFSPN